MDNGCPAADGARGLELYQKMAKESETLLPMKSDWRSFCMGFSQGGAVSLATHREIEGRDWPRCLPWCLFQLALRG